MKISQSALLLLLLALLCLGGCRVAGQCLNKEACGKSGLDNRSSNLDDSSEACGKSPVKGRWTEDGESLTLEKNCQFTASICQLKGKVTALGEVTSEFDGSKRGSLTLDVTSVVNKDGKDATCPSPSHDYLCSFSRAPSKYYKMFQTLEIVCEPEQGAAARFSFALTGPR